MGPCRDAAGVYLRGRRCSSGCPGGLSATVRRRTRTTPRAVTDADDFDGGLHDPPEQTSTRQVHSDARYRTGKRAQGLWVVYPGERAGVVRFGRPFTAVLPSAPDRRCVKVGRLSASVIRRVP